jgi:hypothetical protein
MKRNVIIGIVLILTIATSIIYVGVNDDEFGMKEQGKKTRLLLEGKNDKNIAKIYTEKNYKNNIIITENQLDSYVINLEFTTKQKVDKAAALKELIEYKSLYLLACEEGYEVNDDAIKKQISQTRDAINSSDEDKLILKNYLSGIGISEEEYFEQLFDKYKVNLTIGNYKNNKLKKELTELEPNLIGKDFTEDFNNKLDTYMDKMLDEKQRDNKITVEIYE